MTGLHFCKIHYIYNMKKLFICILLIGTLILPQTAIADDVDLPATGDMWDNWNTRQDEREAKPVSDEEFDKALEQVDKKVNKWKNWAERRKIPKGEEFSQSNETEIINNSEETSKDSLPVISLPVELKIGEDIVPVGHYQVKCEQTNNGTIMKLYQAHYEIAQFPAIETNDDFGEETISFTKWFTEGDNKIKIIYGSMDFNAYSIIEIKTP